MTPPPTRRMDSGKASSSRAPSLVRIPGRSNPGTGGSAGTDPVATMKASADRDRTAPSSCVTTISFGERKTAFPRTTSTPLAPSRKPTPSTRRATISALRCIRTFQSTRAPFTKRPTDSPSLTAEASSAVCSSTLVGMQPLLRQVPPSAFFSTRTTAAPSCAARSAATYPPVPPPMTTTFFDCSAIIFPPCHTDWESSA